MSEGIWGHSSGNNATHVIFCIDKGLNIEGFILWMIAHKIGFKKLDGCYLGEVETSFIINADNLPIIQRYGMITQQDSILYLTGEYDARDRRRAILRYQDGRPDADLGWFGSCTKAQAMLEDSWTFDPSIDDGRTGEEIKGTYFICKRHWPQQITEDSLKTRQEIARAVGGQSR